MTEEEIDAWVRELESNSGEIYELIGNHLNLEEEMKRLKEKARIQNYLHLQDENEELKKKVDRYEKALKEVLKDEYSDNWYIANKALNEK